MEERRKRKLRKKEMKEKKGGRISIKLYSSSSCGQNGSWAVLF